MNLTERNREILRKRQNGATYSELAAEYELTLGYLGDLCRRLQWMEDRKARRSATEKERLEARTCGTCIWAVPRVPHKSSRGAKQRKKLVCLVEACPTDPQHPRDSGFCHCAIDIVDGVAVPREWEPKA